VASTEAMKESFGRFAGERSAFNTSFDWQYFCNKVGQEHQVT